MTVGVGEVNAFASKLPGFVLLTIGAFATGSTGVDLTKAGGWAGLVTAALAWYASFAGVTNSTFKRTMLPTWPLS